MTPALCYSRTCQTLLGSRGFLGCFGHQSLGKNTLQGYDVNNSSYDFELINRIDKYIAL